GARRRTSRWDATAGGSARTAGTTRASRPARLRRTRSSRASACGRGRSAGRRCRSCARRRRRRRRSRRRGRAAPRSSGPDRGVVASVPWPAFYDCEAAVPPIFARLIPAAPSLLPRRRLARRGRVGGANRGLRPHAQLGGILEHLDRHAPIRHRDGPSGDGAKRLAARGLVGAAVLVADLEEQLVGRDDPEEALARIEADAAEHPLRAQLADLGKLIEHEVAKLRRDAQRAKLDARARHRYSRGTRAPLSTVSLGNKRWRPLIVFS